ncbi:MAG: hypothetical protein CME45_00095 [Halieaceae bacterium]|nr:hypothetical protein [Halieaceae bacterium]
MNQAKINFNTSRILKIAFLDLCKEQHVTATSIFNDFMRSMLEEFGRTASRTVPKKDTRSLDGWRDDLVRG